MRDLKKRLDEKLRDPSAQAKRARSARDAARVRLASWGPQRFWKWLKAKERLSKRKLAELSSARKTAKVLRAIAKERGRVAWLGLVREEAEKLWPASPRLPSDRELRRRKVGLLAREGQLHQSPKQE